jgi:hypothetical protein
MFMVMNSEVKNAWLLILRFKKLFEKTLTYLSSQRTPISQY